MELEGRTVIGGNDVIIPLNDNDNSQLVTKTTADYEYASINEQVFIGANLGGTPVATQAGLSATTPALTLYNPVNSGVNLVLLTVTVGITADPAAESVLMLAYNSSTATAPSSTTDATMVSSVIGSTPAPKGRCYRVATLAAAPVAFRFLGSVLAASSTAFTQIIDKVNGEVVIPPGGCVSIQATSAISVLVSYSWKEVAV